MLLVPVLTSNDQKKIPYVCITLILLNCCIFFFIQSNDSQHHEKAYTYYRDSGLLDIELAAYVEYLAVENKENITPDLSNDDERSRIAYRMLADEEFGRLLDKESIITPEHTNYSEWQEKRTEYQRVLNKSITHRFGYSPREKNSVGLVTCMFLHGSTMHLIGNMVFLYLVGAILEAAVGPVLFSLLYLVTGICASALFGIIYPASPGPLVGASGAISGLMGAYGVIFGLRRIRVFYSLGFYFNYAKIPALVLFPIWLANEYIQLNLNEDSNVAYVAHIGGLLSGILVGAVYKILLKVKIESLFIGEKKKLEVDTLLDSGMKKIIKLDLQSARKDFQKLLALEPDNIQAIRQLYAIDKSTPASDRFHESAKRLLHHLKSGQANEYLEVFEEYKTIAEKPRLSLGMLEQLSYLYISKKQYGKAAPYITTLLKQYPENGKLPGFLLSLGQGLHYSNRLSESRTCYQALVQRYPGTVEGRAATRMLNKMAEN